MSVLPNLPSPGMEIFNPITGTYFTISVLSNDIEWDFGTYIRRQRTEHWGIPRSVLTELVSDIETSLLLGITDPDFPKSHPKEDFPDEYRECLDMWVRRLRTFLSEPHNGSYNFC